MAEYWGYHLVVDAGQCDKLLITSEDNIRNFVTSLVQDIDMVAYGDPVIVHFAKHDPSKAGYSLVQLIETSNICAHFVDATGEAYFDIFSCKDFDDEIVVDLIERYFDPKTITQKRLLRKALTI